MNRIFNTLIKPMVIAIIAGTVSLYAVQLDQSFPVKKGDELGHFLYGGSLFIMFFEKEKFKSDAIRVRLGNQIGTFDTP